MSDALNSVAAAEPVPLPEPGGTIPTPTVTHYQQIASKLSETVTAAFADVTSFEAPHASTLGFVRSHQSVSTAFIATVISAVEATGELQSVKKFDTLEARDTLQFIEAFRPVVDLMNALARDLKFTIDARKAKVAADALQIYDIAKGVARDPGSASVSAHVHNMRRDLGRARPKARAPQPPEPAPKETAPKMEGDLKKQ